MVMVFSALLLVGGIWTASEMPVDVFPDLTAPTVTILTEGHGMAPEEMESLVTFPLESAINGASNVRRVRSATALGVAVVWVEFDWGTDIFLARQVVAEKRHNGFPENVDARKVAVYKICIGRTRSTIQKFLSLHDIEEKVDTLDNWSCNNQVAYREYCREAQTNCDQPALVP